MNILFAILLAVISCPEDINKDGVVDWQDFALLQSKWLYEYEVEMANTLTRHAITWTFDKDVTTDGAGDTYQYGQFANGDYYIVGACNIIDIDPAPTQDAETGRVTNGSMINPSASFSSYPYGRQGYDSGTHNFDASYCEGIGVSAGSPLALSAGDYLISTQTKAAANSRPQVLDASVLTVLASAPAANSFRPGYCSGDTTVSFNVSDLSYTPLATLSLPASAPAMATVEGWFEKLWLNHVGEWTGAAIHPQNNMRSYGRDIAHQTGQGGLMLNANFTNAQKETLMIRYVQLGIDLYSIIEAGGTLHWINNGGHAPGRKLPILFAGIVLDDTDMKNIGQKSGDYLYSGSYGPGNVPPDYIHFGEDDQTFEVAQFDVDTERSGYYTAYTSEMIGTPEWGIRHATHPGQANSAWATAYRDINGLTYLMTALTLLAMESGGSALTLWNHDVFIHYTDRWYYIESGSRSGFHIDMWSTYRSTYSPAVGTYDLPEGFFENATAAQTSFTFGVKDFPQKPPM